MCFFRVWNIILYIFFQGHYELHNPIPIREVDEDGHGGWTCHFSLDFSPDSRYLATATKHNGDSSTVIHDLEHKVNVVDAINGAFLLHLFFVCLFVCSNQK